MKKLIALTTTAMVGLAIPSNAMLQEWEIDFEASAELRTFLNDPILPEQLETFQPSFTLQQDIRRQSTDGKHQIVITPWMRLDGGDEERSHFDLREGYYRYNSDHNWSLSLGVEKVFWGKTESRHLVDIINQTDGVEDIDEEDKLGQPMAHFSYLSDYGTVDLYLMTGFRDRTFPGPEGRLRFSIPVDEDSPVFTRAGKRTAVDVAARYSHYIGNWDFGVAAFHGTSREPRLAVAVDGQSLRPVYDEITQGSVDVQYTKGAWLWKLESIVRDGHGDTFFAGVGGVEYTLYQLFGQNWDLGLLAEYQYDDRDEGIVLEEFGATTLAPITTANNDVFLGSRLALNDIQDTSALFGAIVDADDSSTGIFIEAERRIGNDWKAELETRLFINEEFENPAYVFRDDDFVTMRVTRYF
jgi:hypothetical protein